MSNDILEVKNLSIEYKTEDGFVRAVNDASFSIEKGEQFGLAGESGCGKSTLAKAVLGGLDENGRIVSGKIIFDGNEIQDLSESKLNQEVRWNGISMIPQSSMNSLDPIMKLSEQAIELAKTHKDWSRNRALNRFKELFEAVGLPQSRIHDYPHEFSGGMSQRAIIALSLLFNPSLIIADEPTTALDVIMQDQIINYITESANDYDMSIMFITHDISVIFENCDSMALMHGGQIAEVGSVDDVFDQPRHPYSILLQRAFPDIRHPNRELSVIQGQPPRLTGEVDYCTFADRCPWAIEDCMTAAPPLEPTEHNTDHQTSCIRSGNMSELVDSYNSMKLQSDPGKKEDSPVGGEENYD